MSLAQTQQIMADLKDIMALLTSVQTKSKQLTTDAPVISRTATSFRQLERVALRYLVLSRSIGLPDNVNQALQTISKIIIMMRMLQMAANSLAMGPVGVLLGIAEIATVAVAAPSLLEGY